MATGNPLQDILGSMMGGGPRKPRRKAQQFPHMARLDAAEKAIARAHGFEVWQDHKPNRGCCNCGYNVFHTGDHLPAGDHRQKMNSHIPLGWDNVHRSEVFELLKMATGETTRWDGVREDRCRIHNS
jgi:hypothetical protein